MKQFKIIFLVYIALIHTVICENDGIVKELKIRGTFLKSHSGLDFYAFRGIPYAKPPVGERRFKDPEPYGKFDDIFDATKDGHLCPQNKKYLNKNLTLTVSEDCLNLNVYTKTLSTEAKKPVIVYIHGGGYKLGSGNSEYYHPKYLLDEDIVLVTLNYRLGPFGFLVSGTKNTVGNYGFKDQNLALKWVKENIEYFGGDPNSVTLFGHSAGSMSVVLQMLSPMSKNLFHRAIALSAAPTSHWKPDNVKWTKLLAESVGCPTEDGDEMVDCLRGKPWEVLDDACLEWEPYDLINLRFNYEIEEDFGQERFLTADPSVSFKNGDFHKVPLIVGVTKEEFEDQARVVTLNTELFNEVKENFNKFAPSFFGYDYKNVDTDMISNKIKEFFFGNKGISISTERELGEIFSDTLINHPVHKLVQFASQYVDVYYFRMDYKGSQTCSYKNSYGEPIYVAHEDILNYVFVFRCAPEFKNTDPDFIMIKRLVKYFTNFVKYSNPNTDLNEDEVKCTNKWTPSKNGNVKTLYIDETCSMNDEFAQDRFEFWDKLFPVNEKQN